MAGDELSENPDLAGYPQEHFQIARDQKLWVLDRVEPIRIRWGRNHVEQAVLRLKVNQRSFRSQLALSNKAMPTATAIAP
jgi:hypothetical protein